MPAGYYTLLRPSPTHLIFTTPTGAGAAPTSIDKAVLTFSEFDPDPDLAVVVPTLAPMPDQYLVTRVEPHFTVATAKVLGLARADIDSGDPVLVDVKHTRQVPSTSSPTWSAPRRGTSRSTY